MSAIAGVLSPTWPSLVRSDRLTGDGQGATLAEADLTSGRAELLAAREGDEAAARKIVAAHGPSMVKTVWRVLASYAHRDADDVVQEAFIAAWTTDALPEGDLGAWLRAIAARKALDLLRKRKRLAEQSLPGGDEENGPEPALPGDPAETRADVMAARAGLARLAPVDRAILTLVDLEGFSMAEVASALGLTRAAVKLRAMRARRKLARAIDEGPGFTA